MYLRLRNDVKHYINNAVCYCYRPLKMAIFPIDTEQKQAYTLSKKAFSNQHCPWGLVVYTALVVFEFLLGQMHINAKRYISTFSKAVQYIAQLTKPRSITITHLLHTHSYNVSYNYTFLLYR